LRALSAAALACLLLPAGGSAELAGEAAPDFVLKSIAGPNLRLSEYRGRIVVLGFWASWCGDCRAQMRGLAELFGRYQGADFKVLTVSLDPDRRQADKAADSLELGFPVLHDPEGAVGERYRVARVPYLAVIDRDGVVRAEFDGYSRGEEDLYIEQVRALLSE
jgi:peroxiredoxin